MRHILKLIKTIYDRKVIDNAVKDYGNIAEIRVYEDDLYFIAEFNKCIIDSERVKKEFANYVIGSMGKN